MSLIRKGDKVVVISGKDKGKTGKVLEVNRKESTVLVEGVNYRIKHEKVRQTEAGQAGGRFEAEAPLHVSKVMYLDPATNRGVRLGITKGKDGERTRVVRGRNDSNGKNID